MNCSPALFFAGGWLLWFYTIAVLIAELIIGGKAADLVAHYYDFSLNGISIDAFCRDIYKDTKSVGITFIAIAACCTICCVIGLVYFCATIKDSRAWQPFFPGEDCNFATLAPILSSAVSTMLAVAYGGFLTWKLHSLNSDCRAFWDTNVSPGFVNLLYDTQRLLIATAAVGGFWVIVFIIGFCLQCYVELTDGVR